MAKALWSTNDHSSRTAGGAVDLQAGMEGVLNSLKTHDPTHALTLDTFLETQKHYFATLSAEEKADLPSCQSSAQLIREIKNTAVFPRTNHERRLRNSLGKVQRFTEKLEPYFDAIGLIVQSHPEIAGIIWGSIRAALLFACNYVTFFEKLANTLDTLATKLPQLEELQQILRKYGREPSTRLKFALQQIYLDLFFFFKGVSGVFKRKDGRSRWMLSIVAQLSITPFEVRFKDLQLRLDQQDEVIRREIQITHLEISMAQLTAQESVSKLERENTTRLAQPIFMREKEATANFESTHALYEERRHEYTQCSERAIKNLRGRAAEYVELCNEHHEQHEQQRFFEKDMLADKILRIQAWLDAPEFSGNYDEHCAARESGTTQWFFREAAFETWKSSKLPDTEIEDQFHQKALYVSGDPGNGKSVLAAAAVEGLHDPPNSHCYYFFFSELLAFSRRDSAYRSILAQALHYRRDDPDLIETFEFAIVNSSKGQKTASIPEMIDLIRICFDSGSTTYAVFDGIDECDDKEDFVSDIIEVFGPCDAKVLMFGRPNVIALMDALPLHRRFNIGKRTESDIRHYATSQLQLIKQRRLMPADADLQELADHLVSGSDGMFLWAKLMIAFLKLPVWQPKKRVKLILNITTPERLDDFYTRIMAHIYRLESAERQLAEWIITWLMYAQRELSAEELRESSRLVYTETEEEANEEDHFEQSVIVSCACLVKKDSSQKPPVFRFVHVSVKDFLHHTEADNDRSIFLPRATSHAIIARSCIQYLLTCISPQPPSGNVGESICKSSLVEKYPLSNYSALSWIYHLEQSLDGAGMDLDDPKSTQHQKYWELVTTISAFLSAPGQITVWIEAHYIFGSAIGIESLTRCAEVARSKLKNLPELCHEDVWEQLSLLAEYLQTLSENWGQQLIWNPSCIRMECAAFEPNPFIAQTDMMEVHKFDPEDEESSGLSKVSLKTISATSPDGVHLAVLSIWPSRAYQDLAMRTNQRLSWTEDMNTVLKRLSAGWIARYQVFSIANDPVAVFELNCTLDRSKVWTQIRQSLWKDGQGTLADTCRLQCPVAISPSLRRFSVLGDVYTPQPARNGQPSYHISSVVPDFNDILKEAWDMSASTSTYGTDTGYSRTVTLDSWIHRNCMLYLYWIGISMDGRYAFFLDKISSKPSNLAVYDLGHPDSASEPRLVNSGSAQLYRGTKEIHCDAVTFHPSQALVVFTIVGCVYLWPYNNDISSIEQIYYGFDSFESVTFTSCGKFVIVKPVAAMYPVTREIPLSIRKLLDTLTVVEDVHSSSTELGEWMGISKQSIFPKVSDVDVTPSSVVYGGQVSVRKDGSTSGITTNCGANNDVQVRLWSDDAKACKRSETNIEFLKLPSWIDAEAVSTSLLPQLREERIRMVVEQSRKPWSDLSKKGKSGPVLVERNRWSMNYYYRQKLGGKATGVPYSLAARARVRLNDGRASQSRAVGRADDLERKHAGGY